MRKKLCLILTFVSFILSSCSESSTPVSDNVKSSQDLPSSLKGYELYSWNMNNEWSFTLVTGTNQNKTYEEIYSDQEIFSEDGFVKLRSNNIESLKDSLERIPEGEILFWRDDQFLAGDQGEMPEISLPDDGTLKEIELYCDQLGIDLQI